LCFYVQLAIAQCSVVSQCHRVCVCLFICPSVCACLFGLCNVAVLTGRLGMCTVIPGYYSDCVKLRISELLHIKRHRMNVDVLSYSQLSV